MADEDAGRSRERDRGPGRFRDSDEDDLGRVERAERAQRSRERNSTDDTDGFSFSLPPITLPEVRLPDRVRLFLGFPEPPEKVRLPTRVHASRVLLAVALADALDGLAVLWLGPDALPWARAVAGTLLSILLVGLPGLLYAWELLATLAGFGWLSVAPTVTLLVVAKLAASP